MGKSLELTIALKAPVLVKSGLMVLYGFLTFFLAGAIREKVCGAVWRVFRLTGLSMARGGQEFWGRVG